MIFILLLFGIMAIYAAYKGRVGNFGALLKESFAFRQFVAWVIVVIVLAALGRNKQLKPISNGLLGLMILGMLLSQRGAFAKASDLVNKIGR